MVKIRLTRTGRKHQPHFRIVAVDSRKARDAAYIERIGYYNPRTKPPTLAYDKDILKKWMENGAQMSETVFDIFVREGILKKSDTRKAQIDAIIAASKARKAAETAEEDGETAKPEEKTESKEQEKKEDQKDTGKKEAEATKDEKSKDKEPEKKS